MTLDSQFDSGARGVIFSHVSPSINRSWKPAHKAPYGARLVLISVNAPCATMIYEAIDYSDESVSCVEDSEILSLKRFQKLQKLSLAIQAHTLQDSQMRLIATHLSTLIASWDSTIPSRRFKIALGCSAIVKGGHDSEPAACNVTRSRYPKFVGVCAGVVESVFPDGE